MPRHWNGSIAAQREYEEALRKHPPIRKKAHKKKKSKKKEPVVFKGNYSDYLVSNWWKQKRIENVMGQRTSV